MNSDALNLNTKPKIKWHHHYCDPDAKLTLVSNDGIHFKVDNFLMCRASGLFANMRDSATPSTMSVPLSIDTTAEILATFLDLIYTSRFDAPLKLERCLSLLPLCDFFDSSDIASRIQSRLEVLSETQTEDAFAAASRTNNINLAKRAIRNMGTLEVSLWELKAASKESGYLVALLDSISKHLPEASKDNDKLRFTELYDGEMKPLTVTGKPSTLFGTYNLGGPLPVKRKREEFWWRKVEDDFDPAGTAKKHKSKDNDSDHEKKST